MTDNCDLEAGTTCSELNFLNVFITILSRTRLVEIALWSIDEERLINGIINENKSVKSK